MILREHEVSSNAVLLGRVEQSPQGSKGRVLVKSAIGVSRILDVLTGEQLPRIC